MVIIGPTTVTTILIELAIQKCINAGICVGIENCNSIHCHSNGTT